MNTLPHGTLPHGTDTPDPRPDTVTRTRTRRRLPWIVGGAVAGAAVLAAGGIALGAAIADEADDDDRTSTLVSDHDDSPDGISGDAATTDVGTTSAAELIAALEAARGVAEGDAVSIDADRDGGWEVTLRATDGSESEVRVSADGSTAVVESEGPDDDGAPAATLDPAAIESLVAAALAVADGRITDLDVDDDGASAYEARVVTDDRGTVEIELDAAFAVVGTDS